MEEIRKDLEEVIRAVKALDGCVQYLSQRVAWSEVCFKQVQDSGAMKMAEATRQVMTDHKRLLTQVNILNGRVKALMEDSDSGDQGGGTTSSPAGDIDQKIWALAVELNDYEVGSPEAGAILNQLAVLQGERERQPRGPRPWR
jgi:hypothetical protein